MIWNPKKTPCAKKKPRTAAPSHKSAELRTHRRRGGGRRRGPRACEVGGPVGAHLAVQQRGRPRRAQQQRQPRGALHLRLARTQPLRPAGTAGGRVQRLDPGGWSGVSPGELNAVQAKVLAEWDLLIRSNPPDSTDRARRRRARVGSGRRSAPEPGELRLHTTVNV